MSDRILGQISSSEPLEPNDFVSTVFQINDETFFIRTHFLVVSGSDGLIDFGEPLFKLQRRQYGRISANKISRQYGRASTAKIEGSKFQIISVNGEFAGGCFSLEDISGGGFSIYLKGDHRIAFSVGDFVNGRIIIPGRADETVNGEIRHRKMVDLNGMVTDRFGIQFRNMHSRQQQRILQVVFDVFIVFADLPYKKIS